MTSIKEIGGEFGLLSSLFSDMPEASGLFKGIGDDCAVLECGGGEEYQLVTTDMLVDGDHFSRDYFNPCQIGRKCIEANFSDIAAMGGLPDWVFVSISLPGKESSFRLPVSFSLHPSPVPLRPVQGSRLLYVGGLVSARRCSYLLQLWVSIAADQLLLLNYLC